MQSQDVDIVNEQGSAVSEAFLEAMEAYRQKNPDAQRGLVWRWILGQPEGGEGIYLMTQMLPCAISMIKAKPELREDHTLGVLAQRTPVVFDKFTGEIAPGPVPVFFSNSPEESLKQLQESPEYAFHCMQRLVSRLLAKKEISR